MIATIFNNNGEELRAEIRDCHIYLSESTGSLEIDIDTWEELASHVASELEMRREKEAE